VHKGFWWGNLREDPDVNERIIRCIFKKWNRGACTGLNMFGIGTDGGLL
jgi:hypothetical protein